MEIVYSLTARSGSISSVVTPTSLLLHTIRHFVPCTELSLECYCVLCDLRVFQHELCDHTSLLSHTLRHLVACTEVSLQCRESRMSSVYFLTLGVLQHELCGHAFFPPLAHGMPACSLYRGDFRTEIVYFLTIGSFSMSSVATLPSSRTRYTSL